MQRIIDSRYKILEPLGGGGVGEVFLARDEVLGRQVALKILARRYAGDEEFVERFKREARSTASLSHPNIVAVYDLGETSQISVDNSGESSGDPTLYITMEYVPGTTLSDLIQEQGALPPLTAASIALRTACGLEAAHAHDIIHRDVKPANILLSGSISGAVREGFAGPAVVKVADFGIARRLTEETLTEKNAVMGTALYLSPEQALGKNVGPKSDLYSLGIVLYEMLTGQRPFEAGEMDSPLALAMKHVNEVPRPLIALNPDVPPALDALTLCLLHKEPEGRPESAAALARELEKIIEVEPCSLLLNVGTQEHIGEQNSGVPATSQPAQTRREPAPHRLDAGQSGKHRGTNGYVALTAGSLILVLVLLTTGMLSNLQVRDAVNSILPESSRSSSEDPANVEPTPLGSTESGTTVAPEAPKTTAKKPIEAEVRQAVRDYYDAVDRQNWAYTYNNLDFQSREMFTREEWYRKNQWFADRESLKLTSMNVELGDLKPSDTLSRVNVYRTFEEGAVVDRDTVFVYEGGAWKHRLVGNELVFFRPDATYEEFVETQQGG